MTVKILAGILLLFGLKWLYDYSFTRQEELPEKPIDQAWWDGLSDEWQNILRINQYFHRHQVDFYAVQQAYIQRLNEEDDSTTSVYNLPLREWLEKQTYLLSYQDLYARVRKSHPDTDADSIDLNRLAQLDRIYMVSGPGDLSPLKKFPKLRILVINYCGINHSLPIDEQVINLEPLRKLTQLEQLYCVSPALKTLEPIKGLQKLTTLHCQNSDVSTLEPVKNLTQLEHLAFGAKVKKAAVLGRFHNLKTLHISGCQEIPDLSGLKNLQQLSIVENELALVNSSFRIKSLDFLENLPALEVLDLELTSYRGSLDALKNHSQLKAVTLPRVSSADMQAFKQAHPGCRIVNEYEW
ncbi:MAG TPA: hypothetical protein VK168_14100 [Saprospiraceae bacterium]|nr:hypothetical protein [Saprospiraceae bacterium]